MRVLEADFWLMHVRQVTMLQFNAWIHLLSVLGPCTSNSRYGGLVWRDRSVWDRRYRR